MSRQRCNSIEKLEWLGMTERATPSPRSHFSVFYPLNSRWADNDIYGHINNVAYYAFLIQSLIAS